MAFWVYITFYIFFLFQHQISQNEMPSAVDIWKFPARTERKWIEQKQN